MIFKQLFDFKSSTYTYLISSGNGREALIIDPVIENVSEYISLLKELDLKLVKVIDTHIHADHVTGASKLKDITKCSTIMGTHTPAETVEIKVKDAHTEKGQEIIRKAKKLCKDKKIDNVIFSSFNHDIIGLDGYLADTNDKLNTGLKKLKINNYLIIDYYLKNAKILKKVNKPIIVYNVPETEDLNHLNHIQAAITDYAN